MNRYSSEVGTEGSRRASAFRLLVACSIGLVLAGCAVGPDYVRPEVPVDKSFAMPVSMVSRKRRSNRILEGLRRYVAPVH
jgi:hypothetical protein